ncbi:MAG: hypothetical protein WCR46_02335 [Deltaproteobacteria bacterium]
MILDIEAPGKDHHSNIAANLESGREFLRIICEYGLEIGLIIFLSGKGLRFCWPYLVSAELQKAFNAWISSPDYPMIDASPHTKKAFYRMFANRNHTNQGAILDRHIHRLEDVNDLWLMNENDYLALVSNTIDLKTSLQWLNEILPTCFTPEPWTAFLQKFKTRAALADTIYKPIFPLQKSRKPIAFLAEQAGLEFRSLQISGGEILQLKTCLICGRSDGRPWITQAGRLKCHHQNSCKAGQVNEMGNIIGLPASEWLPGNLSDDFNADETLIDDSERITIQAARDQLQAAFHVKEDTYITLSPGAGKTHTVLLEVLGDELGKVAIATPEHKLNAELFELAKSKAKNPDQIYMLQGRNNDNCTRFDKVQTASKAGYPPGILVCSRCTFKRDKSCEYINQFNSLKKSDGLWLMTHAMSLELDLRKFKLLIVDESPLKTFLQKLSSNLGAMERIQSKLSPEGRTIMNKLMAVIPAQLAAIETAKASKYDLSRIYTAGAPPESPWSKQPGLFDISGISPDEVDHFDRELSFFYQLPEEKYPQYLKRLYYQEHIDLTALNWLQGAVSADPGYYVRFRKDRIHPAKFISFKKRLPQYAGRIIALDATGNLVEIESLFERKFTHIQGKVEMPGLRTAHIKQASGKKLMSRKSDKQIADMLKSGLDFLQPTDKKILIVTHMVAEETVKRLAADVLPDREIATCHFWGGSRGVNQFGDCTAVIAMGTPFPNIGGLFDHAMSLITEPSDRIKWIVNTGTAELIQALHRVRPVKGGRTVIVVGKDFPATEFGLPQFKVNRQRGNKVAEPAISEILNRLEPFVDAFKITTRATSWMLGVCLSSDLDKMRQVHEMIKNNIENGNLEYEKKYSEYEKSRISNFMTGKDSKPADFTYYNTLVSKIPSSAILSYPKLILNNHVTWDSVLRLLAERFQLPENFSLSDGRKVTGIGYLSDVQAFYESLNANFNPAQWTGTQYKEENNA